LAGGTTSVIGLIVHEIDDPFFTEIAGGIVRSALAENLMVQVSHSGRDPEQELQEITTLVVQDVDGIIIAGSGYVDPAKEAEPKTCCGRISSEAAECPLSDATTWASTQSSPTT
jgi:LacI family transcriptional regulator